jgi:hypothetical protein
MYEFATELCAYPRVTATVFSKPAFDGSSKKRQLGPRVLFDVYSINVTRLAVNGKTSNGCTVNVKRATRASNSQI